MLYVKKLIELFQIYDSNCSIFSKELNCFDRQLGFKKFKNEIIEKNENRLKTSFNFFEKKCWPNIKILIYYYMSQGESHSWAIQKSIIK